MTNANYDPRHAYKWAEALMGRKIRGIWRLLEEGEKHPKSINHCFQPIKLEMMDGEAFFLTVDEGKGNLISFPYSVVVASRPKVFGEFVLLEVDTKVLFGLPDCESFGLIKGVNVLSQKMEDYLPDDYFSVCGLKFISESGMAFSVGTHLTDLRLAGLWLVPSGELADFIHERQL